MATLPTERKRDRSALASPCPKLQLETEAKTQKHMKMCGSSNDRYIRPPFNERTRPVCPHMLGLSAIWVNSRETFLALLRLRRGDLLTINRSKCNLLLFIKRSAGWPLPAAKSCKGLWI